jgi:hypothetical protein
LFIARCENQQRINTAGDKTVVGNFSTQQWRALPMAWIVALGAILPAASLALSVPALALSEIGQEEQPAQQSPDTLPGSGIPTPEPIVPGTSSTGEPNSPGTMPAEIARPSIDEDSPLPEIIYNLDRLPEPVRRMHDLIVEAARSGEIERLRPLIGMGDSATQLSFGGVEGDPIEFLKTLSGDAEGQEILAIMEEVLDAGFVKLDPGTPNELYVWPYFFGIPLDRLDPRQRVELFKIVTAGDYEDMKAFGTYIFYRVGITPEGSWAFFVAGD